MAVEQPACRRPVKGHDGMAASPGRPRIGTAGWSVPGALSARFPGDGAHLERYARVLPCAEIDTSFYRPHRRSTYERWAGSTPSSFRFAVKLPRSVTHEARLHSARAPLDAFLEQVGGLGRKLGVLLIQLPPSLAFDPALVADFLQLLRGLYSGRLACEPREQGWFTPDADGLLASFRVARVAADPAFIPEAASPGGWQGRGATRYFRWHGSPHRYWSSYGCDWLRARRDEIARLPRSADCWCVFDNTAGGAALGNALEFSDVVAGAAAA